MKWIDLAVEQGDAGAKKIQEEWYGLDMVVTDDDFDGCFWYQ